jgi:glutamyl-tRNA(Gln) amidotransferase subunit E
MDRERAASESVIGPPPEENPRSEPALDFPDRAPADMTAGDYAAIGFLSGLEVHQQLLTESKLFCRCPAGQYVERTDAVVLRHMRPTLSELGEYDRTALMEFKTKKEIVYLLERGTVCTYEIDDTPPFHIDDEAVRIAIEMCLLFDLGLVSELHVMRKQYLDGSIPTGFQRTAMVGLGGVIPFRVPELGVDRPLRIRQLSLEEDACREVSDVGHRITFRTDRLGTPLTEVVTEPDLHTPLELQAAARLIARTARATKKIRRGPGAARQDVNVSVAGGRRVEIKGVDNHRNLPRLVHIEGFRQLNLLRIRAELRRRGLAEETFIVPAGGDAWNLSPLVIDATAALRKIDFAPLRESLEGGGMAGAVRLPGFGGVLTRRTQPGAVFAREMEDRVRVIACLTARPFMIHSDIRDYALRSTDWQQLRRALRTEPGDATVVVWGPRRDVDTAAREILIRAAEALKGIPPETRQAYPDGTTGFERILPGADRMYPDTDTPPVAVPDEWVTEIRSSLREPAWSRIERYRVLGFSPNEIETIVDAPWGDLFDELLADAGAHARRLATAFQKRLTHHRRTRKDLRFPSADDLRPIVRAVERDEIRPEALEIALEGLLRHPDLTPETFLESVRPRPTDERKLEELLLGLADRADAVAGKSEETILRWAMGEVMRPLRGRVDPQKVRRRVHDALTPRFVAMHAPRRPLVER